MHVDVLAFLAIAILLIVMPGPDTAMVTKNALVGGRRSGMLAAVGVTVGLFIWTTAARARDRRGAESIGGRLRRPEGSPGLSISPGSGSRCSPGRAESFPRGRPAARRAACGLSGRGCCAISAIQRSAIFFTSLLPQFVHGTGPAFVPLLFLGRLFAVLTLLWLAVYALAVGHASGWLRRPPVRLVLDRFTGLVLIGFRSASRSNAAKAPFVMRTKRHRRRARLSSRRPGGVALAAWGVGEDDRPGRGGRDQD